MTKYTSLALTGGSLLAGIGTLVLAIGYFTIVGKNGSQVEVSKPVTKDTITIVKTVITPADTVVVFKPCKRNHCDELVKSSQSLQQNDSALKNQETNGN